MASRLVLATVAVMLACSMTLQGCGGGSGRRRAGDPNHRIRDAWDNFSASGRKALAQAGEYAKAAAAHAETAVKDAREQADALIAKRGDLLAAAKKKIEAAKAEATKAVAAATKAGGKQLKAAQAKLKEAQAAAGPIMDKAKKAAASLKDEAAKAVAKGEKAAADLKEKAAAATKDIAGADVLRKAAASAKAKYAEAKKAVDSALEHDKAAGEKLVKACKEGGHCAAAEKKAESLIAAAKKEVDVSALKAASDKATGKAEEALTTAKKSAVAAKATAVADGAPSKLFELIPDGVDGTIPDEIDEVPQKDSAIYYAGLASVCFVTFAAAMIAFRKISLSRSAGRTPVSQTIEDAMMADDEIIE